MSAAVAVDNQAQPQAEHETIELSVGRSNLVSAPWPVAKISVAEPNIADVQVAAPDQVVVLAKGIGRTDLVLWSEDGQSVTRLIDVHVDIAELQGDLDNLFPDARLVAGKSRDLVTIRGMFNRAEDAQRLRTYMDTIGLKHMDMTSVAGVQQVLIKVRIAEASRTAMRALGVNAYYTGNDFYGGSIIDDLTSFTLNPSAFGSDAALSGTFSSATTLFAGIPDADLNFFLRALENNQYMRVLAEPSLIAVSGEEASFLAGGEFPIPVVQGSTGNGSTSITVEFKEFGIRLQFRPVVLGDGTIRIQVAPEVSQLSDVGAVELDGFSIPSLVTRRAETTREMNSGQTFALAGLLNQTTSAQAQSTPGLGNVPVLGSLFRSVRYQEQDTELVVLATVSLVEPLSIVDERPLPGDLHAPPSDWELYANGSIEGRVPAKTSEAHAAWLHERGLDELRGPGAWQSYMTPPGTPMPAASAPAAKESEAPAEAPAQAEAPAETAEKPAESGEAPAVEETK
jgi:pilus assembly protein CpaC